jgi:hypothetical protein
MSIAIIRTIEMVRQLEGQHRPWLEIQHEVDATMIRQGSFEPLYVGCDKAPYRLRLVPKIKPQILSKHFDEELTRIGRERSLVVQMRCTGYNVFMPTVTPDGLTQQIKKFFGKSHKTKLLKVLYLDKYGIEVERPDLPGIPEALEEIGSRLYGMSTVDIDSPTGISASLGQGLLTK